MDFITDRDRLINEVLNIMVYDKCYYFGDLYVHTGFKTKTFSGEYNRPIKLLQTIMIEDRLIEEIKQPDSVQYLTTNSSEAGLIVGLTTTGQRIKETGGWINHKINSMEQKPKHKIMKEVVLRFLNENNTGQLIDISEPLIPFNNDRLGIHNLLANLERDGIIKIHNNFRDVSSKTEGKYDRLIDCNLYARLTPLGQTYCKEHLKNFDNMAEGEKIHMVLEYAIKTNPDQFSWDLGELTLSFDNLLTEYEVQYLCQQLLDNGDVVDCITKDGFAIGINEKSKAAFYGKKYLKRHQPQQPTISIGTIQQIKDTVVHGGLSQSLDSSINKTKTIPAKADNGIIKKILIGIGVGIVVGLILYYIFGIK